MYRYLALVWNSTAEHSRLAARALAERLEASATRWSSVLAAPGVAVFHAGRGEGASDACPLPEACGVVLGKLFSRGADGPGSASVTAFDDAEAARIVASGGRRLFEKYWGRYVAIVHDRATSNVRVLRDPSGSFPCWYSERDGVGVVCSDVEDCRDLGPVNFTVNWEYITGLVAHAGLQVRDTALNEVSEVQPGERLCFVGGAMSRSMEWNPVAIAQTAPLESFDAALALLRATTLDCVQAWASGYERIVHSLSGGLDSSIVLSCLTAAASRPEVTCVNYFGRGPSEDERRYARLMAQHAGVELVEYEPDPKSVRLDKVLELRHSARPWFYLYEIERGELENTLAAERGAQSFFSGGGGDSVFYQARGELAVSDFVFAHGIGRGLLTTAIDAARVSRRSIWPLLWQAVRNRIMQPEWDPIAAAKPLQRVIVAPSVVEVARRNRRLSHPWLTPETIRGVAPGILWHIMSLSMPPSYYSSFQRSGHAERVFPLLSQPLVELCLRIPTYILIRGGHDRALARRAFRDDLPREIVRRYVKGRADQYVRNILDANLPFVREFLLDGLLVKRGLLDRANLELYLSERSPADAQYNEILKEHLATEAWLRKWVAAP
jgi:asparagine synthase (glutamine-hydrolysing)